MGWRKTLAMDADDETLTLKSRSRECVQGSCLVSQTLRWRFLGKVKRKSKD